MTPHTIIGLVGRAGSGKDTVASILAETEDVTPIAFADALREEVKTAFGVGLECMLHRDEKEQPTQALAIERCADQRFIARMTALAENPYSPRSPREILQLWGTEYRRECDSYTYWIDRLQDTIDHHATGGKAVVVTDVRFAKEALSLKQLGGSLWRIYRPIAEVAISGHSSESEIDRIEIDRIIVNDGSIGQLVHATRAAIRKELRG